jgi:tetratricopeptide (TPR) repeat protein
VVTGDAPAVRRVREGTLLIVVLSVSAVILLRPASSRASLSDHATDLLRIQGKLQGLASSKTSTPASVELSTRKVALLQLHAALTGSVPAEIAARAATEGALQRLGPQPDLLLLGADFALRFHDVTRARACLTSLSRLRDGPPPGPDHPPHPGDPTESSEDPPRFDGGVTALALRSDLAIQEGDYPRARRECEKALLQRRDWAVLARLAHLESLRGDAAAADALYAEAEEDLSAKELRAYAWLEQQRGLLWLNRGRHELAALHYGNARRAYSGDWRLEEHEAELLAADRRYDDAVALYEDALTQAPRPEIQQALGDLLAFIGRASAAKVWHDRALNGYLASVERGDVQYLHHLAGFYADVRMDGPTALLWARRDVALRQNVHTQDALAWALFRAGRHEEAREAMDAALESGVRDAHVFFHAALVNVAAGHAEEGRRFLAETARLNPRYDSFHAHR